MRAPLVLAALLAGLLASSSAAAGAGQPSTWLCRPGLTPDPCASSLAATAVNAAGKRSLVKASPARTSAFDCFYVYPTVSAESSTNADLRIQAAEIAVAQAQASRFAQVCQVYAPVYRQVTLAGLLTGAGTQAGPVAIAYNSIAAAFEDFLAHYSDGRPFVLIGHSQGAAMSILLIERLIDEVPALRSRLLLAIILGGNVEVPTGKLAGGSFKNVPGCNRLGETGCVIAYSSFPSTPPAGALFARPGQGVSLQSGQTATHGLEVLCTNPAALAGGSATLDPYFPSLGSEPTPWVTFPGLYNARCEQAGGASWLDVTKATGASDHRPTVTEHDGPLWGYHADDVNLALGNLLSDVAAVEARWRKS
jgi:pimeloyl-ACP methyl ester carboxylesterase